MEYYFLGDPHFHHHRVIKFDNRPFTSIEDMNNSIIDNINAVVNRNDILFILGDFSFSGINQAIELRKRIKCKRVGLIYGNHDRQLRKKEQFQNLWFTTGDIVEMNYKKVQIVMSHYPIEYWNRKHYGTLHLHAHSHKHIRFVQNRLCVSCNLWDYKPISFTQVLEEINAKTGKRNLFDITTEWLSGIFCGRLCSRPNLAVADKRH